MKQESWMSAAGYASALRAEELAPRRNASTMMPLTLRIVAMLLSLGVPVSFLLAQWSDLHVGWVFAFTASLALLGAAVGFWRLAAQRARELATN